jgi:hypothetical protein
MELQARVDAGGMFIVRWTRYQHAHTSTVLPEALSTVIEEISHKHPPCSLYWEEHNG